MVDDRDDDPRRDRIGRRRRVGAAAAPRRAARRLYAVRRIGDATVDEVAEALDMTVSGARQHLTSLTEHGLIRATEIARPDGRRGRPQLSYAATELADALFPKAYGALTNELLGYLDDEDAPPSTGSSPAVATPGSPTPSAGWHRSGR